MFRPLPSIHLLTCAERADSLATTLASWDRTDWGARPRIHVDEEEDRAEEPWGSGTRVRRLTDAYASMLRATVQSGGRNDEWLLFLHDDLDFHPRLAEMVRSWSVLNEPGAVLASLFNSPHVKTHYSSVQTARSLRPRAVAVDPSMFLSAQAILLRFWGAKWVLARWASMQGLPAQRLARLLSGVGPIWAHDPSLVQHVAADSSWGAKVQRAPTFDPGWTG